MTGGPRRALLIVNERSRTGREAARQAEQALAESGIAFDRGAGSGEQDPCAAIRTAKGSVDCVVLGGGDGTLNAALPALLETGLPLGVIPLGTANDFARTLDLPLDPAEAVRIIAAGSLKSVDVGEVNGLPFLNVASVGFGVDLTRALSSDSKRRWGKLGYLVAGLRVLGRMRPFHVTVTVGDNVHRCRTVHLAVGNGRHYGGGMILSEDAAIDDNRLDVYSLEVPGVWALLKILPSLRFGRHGRWAEVETMAGQDVTVETHRPRSVNADGEIVTRTPAHFRVLPGSLQVYAPEQAAGSGALPP